MFRIIKNLNKCGFIQLTLGVINLLESVQHAKIGNVVPVYKEIDGQIDVLEYFAKLSNYGKKKNSLLFEDDRFSVGTASPSLVVSGYVTF